MKDSISVNDFQSVTRFDSFGGGWGYSGHSVEAIRFMADTDVVLGKIVFLCSVRKIFYFNFVAKKKLNFEQKTRFGKKNHFFSRKNKFFQKIHVNFSFV